MFYYYDPTYILLIIAMIISGWAQAKVSSTYSKYSRVYARNGRSAADVARAILDYNGLRDVRIEHIRGNLTDHYDPRSRVLRLSDSVYSSTSVAAQGVAAHEVGHAVQHAEGYAPLKIRNMIVPVANFGTKASWIFIILGALMGSMGLIQMGIIFFSFAVIFQLITLPVEFDASNRALAALEGCNFLVGEEVKQSRKVLSAAAMTYVAAALTAVLQLLRLVLIFGNRRD